MKDTTKYAKEILAICAPLKEGESVTFKNFLKGFGEPVQAHCTEIEPGKFWQFSLFWNSIHLGDVVVEHLLNDVIIETL